MLPLFLLSLLLLLFFIVAFAAFVSVAAVIFVAFAAPVSVAAFVVAFPVSVAAVFVVAFAAPVAAVVFCCFCCSCCWWCVTGLTVDYRTARNSWLGHSLLAVCLPHVSACTSEVTFARNFTRPLSIGRTHLSHGHGFLIPRERTLL